MKETAIELISELENRRYSAMVASDVEELSRLLSDELAYAHSNGERDSKQSYLERVRNGTFTYEWIDHPEEKILVSGGAAVVIGSMTAKAYWCGEARNLRNTTLSVWLKEGAEWRLAAYQPTPLQT
jgi:hypothetical protein